VVSSSLTEPSTINGDAEGVLVTGVYGVGKSTVVAQMADLLEARDRQYAALDLDWLNWADAGFDSHRDDRMLLANIASVVGNYRAFGIGLFVLAGWVGDERELARLRSTMAMPMRVVRLTLDRAEIERRDETGSNTGRDDDLVTAAGWLASGRGEGLEDIAVANDRPVVAVATEILDWLGWS
jgi:adenylylsulfate kinase-like enzyme